MLKTSTWPPVNHLLDSKELVSCNEARLTSEAGTDCQK